MRRTCPRAQGSGNVPCRLFRKNDHSGSGVRSIRGWYGEFREFATGVAIRPWHALDIELSKIFVTTEVLSICLHHGNPIDTLSRGRDSNTKPPAASSSNVLLVSHRILFVRIPHQLRQLPSALPGVTGLLSKKCMSLIEDLLEPVKTAIWDILLR